MGKRKITPKFERQLNVPLERELRDLLDELSENFALPVTVIARVAIKAGLPEAIKYCRHHKQEDDRKREAEGAWVQEMENLLEGTGIESLPQKID